VTGLALLVSMGQETRSTGLLSRQRHRNGPETGIECKYDHTWAPRLVGQMIFAISSNAKRGERANNPAGSP
jgi:hypothetical protein